MSPLKRAWMSERQPWRTLTPATPSTHPAELVSPSERRKSFAWSLVAGLTAAGVVLLLILGSFTLANTNATVNDVRNAQANHTATLERIDRVDKDLRHEITSLASATKTVDQILSEAGMVSNQLLANQRAICQALHVSC
jgi:hypothetical protein